jgi:hypothetical protein
LFLTLTRLYLAFIVLPLVDLLLRADPPTRAQILQYARALLPPCAENSGRYTRQRPPLPLSCSRRTAPGSPATMNGLIAFIVCGYTLHQPPPRPTRYPPYSFTRPTHLPALLIYPPYSFRIVVERRFTFFAHLDPTPLPHTLLIRPPHSQSSTMPIWSLRVVRARINRHH